MVVISIRFARGASKLRFYMDLKTPEKDWNDGEEWQSKNRMIVSGSFRDGAVP
ncbi:hypothetical protein [Edaphobacter aggregans]|uniref:hypothetical protein n=1 Tax=Edaphobacter aggregans TaxID=570835 RepID=UPI001B808FEC|nr:hypothetical protein [Edaphobacter aggregans]